MRPSTNMKVVLARIPNITNKLLVSIYWGKLLLGKPLYWRSRKDGLLSFVWIWNVTSFIASRQTLHRLTTSYVVPIMINPKFKSVSHSKT